MRQQEKGEQLALRQLEQQQAIGQNQLAQTNQLARAQNDEKVAQDTDDRLRALRRATARQRAAFGAQGIVSAGGSAEAVLLGLFEETDRDTQDRQRLDNLRNQAMGLGERQSSALNVLQRTQLQERNKLNNLGNTVGRTSSAINSGLGVVSSLSSLSRLYQDG